ncbi:MAG TPA: alpha/beta fold hydrolase [Geminicoccaceae bacterium]|nr:alpha/beta fold hydrolase [Geminicoccaceae bacterium]
MPLLTRVFLAGLTVSLAAVALAAGRPRTEPVATPRRGTPTLRDDALLAGDGARLPLIAWQPPEPAAVMLGLHGYGDYRRAFRLVGPWLAARRIALFAYDQRGFGETESRGRWPGAAELIQDLVEAVLLLRERYPALPLYVIGESMGASVALAGLGRGEVAAVDRLILAAPAVRGQVPLRELHDLALRLGVLALPWLAVALRRGARPWLEPGEAARLADDPLILRQISVSAYDGLVELANMASEDPAVALPPTLLLYGELDATIPRIAIDDLALRLPGVATRRYAERHHLLLHEKRVDAVLEDCLAWLAFGKA